MFHFAIGRHFVAQLRIEGLPIQRDDAFLQRVEAGWKAQNGNQLPDDLFPLRKAAAFRWDGQTPKDYDLCRMLIEEALKLTPDYIWIEGKARSFRASAAWDLS